MFKKIRHIHFVGVGGSGMSGIAEVLVNLGYTVSGSDLKTTPVTERLAKLGAKIVLGHVAQNIAGAHVVVTSTAVASHNPEVIAARAQNIPVIPRIEMLAEIARLKYTIAIAGTHGKTTTTSMVAAVCQAGGLDPTVVVGGRLKHLDSGARLGKGDYLVAEADESDGSFLKLSPALAIITNIDNDHLDYYGTMEKIAEAFVQYSGRVPFYGAVIACLNDAALKAQLPRFPRRVVTYGFDSAAMVRAEAWQSSETESRFTVFSTSGKLGEIVLRVPGRHNVLNALAAVSAGLELDIPFAKIAEGLNSFEGVGRRLEPKGETEGITVIDDYGHHPTEVKATLSALRACYPKRRIVALFQPHRFSRTQSLWNDFAQSFSDADKVWISEIYPAGEAPMAGVTSHLILTPLAAKHADATAAPQPLTKESLRAGLQSGDVFLTLGAGDVWKYGELLLAK